MPSDLNVIAVRVPKERALAVKRIAAACGMSQSGWINSILDMAIPMSEKAMRAAILGEVAQEEFVQTLRAVVAEADRELEELDLPGGGSADGRKGARPPLSNRGVTNGR